MFQDARQSPNETLTGPIKGSFMQAAKTELEKADAIGSRQVERAPPRAATHGG